MHNHIEKLVEATKDINVTYRAAFGQKGNPDIGVRKENGDSLFVENVFYLVAGDVYNKKTHERISNIQHLGWFKPDGIYVDLRAQAVIAGKIVQIHLGKRDVVSMTRINNEGGTLVLAASEE